MKKILLLSFIMILGLQQTSIGQQKSEKKEIKKVIQNYFEGQRKDNPELIKKVFHPLSALKFISVRDNEYKTITFERYVTFFKNKKERVFKDKIFYIDVSGTAANAKVLVKYDTYQYIHYFNMLKTKDGWQIVNKISSQKNFK